MARVLAISADLLLGSRVEESLRAAGHEVTLVASVEALPAGGCDLLVADLDGADPEALLARGAPVLGYHSHLDPDTGERARAAGVDLVVPRSRMARELPQLVEKLLT